MLLASCGTVLIPLQPLKTLAKKVHVSNVAYAADLQLVALTLMTAQDTLCLETGSATT